MKPAGAARWLAPRSWLAILVASAACKSTAVVGPEADAGPPAFRLSSEVHPLAESLDLELDPARPTFHAIAELRLHLDHPRRSLWLHGRDLRVAGVTLASGGTTQSGAWVPARDGKAEIRFASAVTGDALLHVEYEADLATADVGASRVEVEGRQYIFTELALTEARRVFPCFDEPAFKIPFSVALTIPEGQEAFANAAERTRTVVPGKGVRIAFDETPPLSTYLIAFGVGPFDIVRAPDIAPNAVRSKPVPLRGIAVHGHAAHLSGGLGVASASVEALEDYFLRPFPFEKLDLVAVPRKSGAMENAGAITFADHLLTMDDATASERDKVRAAMVITHEVSHQWLGDLVTASYWDDLWLNEAFATWMGAKVSETIRPGFHVDLVALDDVADAMRDDSRASARAVRQPVRDSDDIQNTLDSITYDKGDGILRMFERWMGPVPFREALRSYVAAHVFGSATARDLVSSLSVAAKRDLTGPFFDFLEKPGVPLVDVRVNCQGAPYAHLAQTRYAPLGSTIDPLAQWSIPLCVAYGKGAALDESCTLLDGPSADVPLRTCPDWLLPNADASGYFHFSLDHAAYQSLRQHLGSLSIRERVALASELRAGWVAGTTTTEDLMGLTGLLARDTQVEVAAAAFATLTQVHDWLFGTPEVTRFEAQVTALLRSDTSERGQRRTETADFLARVARDRQARAEASQRAFRLLGPTSDGHLHPEGIDPDQIGSSLLIAAVDGDERMFESVLAHLETTTDGAHRRALLGALAAFDGELAGKARDFALTPALQGSEPEYLLIHQLQSPRLRKGAWEWLLTHSDALFARSTSRNARLWFVGNPGFTCGEASDQEIEAFLAPLIPKIEGAPREAALAKEQAHLCAVQRRTLLPDLQKYFSRAGSSSSLTAPRASPTRAP